MQDAIHQSCILYPKSRKCQLWSWIPSTAGWYPTLGRRGPDTRPPGAPESYLYSRGRAIHNMRNTSACAYARIIYILYYFNWYGLVLSIKLSKGVLRAWAIAQNTEMLHKEPFAILFTIFLSFSHISPSLFIEIPFTRHISLIFCAVFTESYNISTSFL